MRLAFIGMTGTGKTAVGAKLAERLNIAFADLDDMLVYRLGMSISQAYITFGEKVFRSYESSVLCEVVWQDDIIISLGGGLPPDKNCMELLKDYVKIRLTASPETVYSRIKDDFSRPLIKDNSPPALAKLIAEREEYYTSYADMTINTDNKSISDITEEIYRKII